MAEEVRIWKIEGSEQLQEIARSPLDLEVRLESWLAQDISVLDPGLLVIGRQVQTDFGGMIDLLCLNPTGDVVIVELKRDCTPREITAQVLDYGSWVNDLSRDRIVAIAEAHIDSGTLDEAFKRRFGTDLPETLNEKHRLLIVASRIDPSSERIVRYLSDTYGVNINAATFHYFREGIGAEFLARLFLIEPEQVEQHSRLAKGSKRRPNLTYEELAAIAEQNGAGAIYNRAFDGLAPHLQSHPARSCVGFAENRKTVISLFPGESSESTGLRFRLYIHRLQAVFNLTEEAALAIIPENRAPWIYYPAAGPEYEGYEGFFESEADVDRFVNALDPAVRQVA